MKKYLYIIALALVFSSCAWVEHDLELKNGIDVPILASAGNLEDVAIAPGDRVELEIAGDSIGGSQFQPMVSLTLRLSSESNIEKVFVDIDANESYKVINLSTNAYDLALSPVEDDDD